MDSEQGRYPELVICAGANLVEPGVALAGSNCLPLIISGSTVGVAGQPKSTMRTDDLEKIVGPQGWMMRSAWMREWLQLPIVSLMSSVAMTGAAVSPAMGKMTRPRLRPVLAALNVRLGVWLPNPINCQARNWVREHKSEEFAVGIHHLILEFLGVLSAKNSQVYASDGGHYENLGLVQLIRERCTAIWCIDASGDTPGRASALSEAILLAEAETGCAVELDLTAFGRAAAPNRLLSTYVSGWIIYTDKTVGVLHVVKLGLTDKHSSVLHEYQWIDRLFPFHSTMQQVYTAGRFEAYRRLGWETTNMLIDPLN